VIKRGQAGTCRVESSMQMPSNVYVYHYEKTVDGTLALPGDDLTVSGLFF